METMEAFDKVTIWLQLNSRAAYEFVDNIFIGKLRLQSDKLVIVRTDGSTEGDDFFTVNYDDIVQTIRRNNEIEFNTTNGKVCLGFPFRKIVSIKGIDEFLDFVREKLKTPVIVQEVPIIQLPKVQ